MCVLDYVSIVAIMPLFCFVHDVERVSFMKLEVEGVYWVTHSMLLYICCAQDSYRVVRSRKMYANRDNGVIVLHFEHMVQEAMDEVPPIKKRWMYI